MTKNNYTINHYTPTIHNDWTTTDDTHTMTITLSADGVYTVSIGGEDKAGRRQRLIQYAAHRNYGTINEQI